jgi:NADH-quinone oxidoreductase subunit M
MLDDFGGLAKPMPIYAALFIIATMSSVGVPGLNGFVGEFLVITGTFASDKLGHVSGIQAVGAALGVILAALYMLTAVQKMFFGPITRDENKKLPDITPREMLAVAPLIIAMFVLGLAPNLLLNQMHGAVERTLTDYDFRAKSGTGGRYYDGPIRLGIRRPDTPPPVGKSPEATQGGLGQNPSDETPTINLPAGGPPGGARPGGMPGGPPGGLPPGLRLPGGHP